MPIPILRSLTGPNSALPANMIPAGAVDLSKLADGAVSGAKIANRTIIAEKMAQPSIGTSEIMDGSVTESKVAGANRDGAANVHSMRSLGTGASQAAPGNHAHATQWHLSEAQGTELAIPNNGAYQRVYRQDNGNDLGHDWQMQGTWLIWGQIVVRADSANWTPIESKIVLFHTSGGLVNGGYVHAHTVGNTGTDPSGGTGWQTMTLGPKVLVVPGGQVWMPRLEVHIRVGPYGGVYARSSTDTFLGGHRLDHGPGY